MESGKRHRQFGDLRAIRADDDRLSGGTGRRAAHVRCHCPQIAQYGTATSCATGDHHVCSLLKNPLGKKDLLFVLQGKLSAVKRERVLIHIRKK